MRSINTTSVVVHENGHADRMNMVATLRGDLRRLVRLSLRGACKPFAKQFGPAFKQLQAMYAVPMSPSWGGRGPSGGPGTALSG